jgi:hypothetical protein
MKKKIILFVLMCPLFFLAQTTEIAAYSKFQGFSPFAIEITKDGQYAYLSFDLSEVIFKVRLNDLTVVATADLSAYFPIECEHIALDATEKKLFVHTPSWQKLLVLDTETMGLVHTIENYSLIGMFRSQFGSQLITWDAGNTVRFVNTDTYAVTQHTGNNDVFFLKIQEHKEDPTKWYVVTQGLPYGQGPLTVGLYNHVTKTWGNSVTFPLNSASEFSTDLRVLPNGQKAYVATLGGFYPDNHGYGWLYAVDLATKQVNVVPIDGGVGCLEANPAGTRLYVGTDWPLTNNTNNGSPLPNPNNLLVVDTASDNIMGPIPLGRNIYGWPYTQMNDLQIDPTNPRFLYATSSDGNAFIKVDIDGSAVAGALVLNNATFGPHFFVRRQTESFGNILILHSAKSFELDLNSTNIRNVVTFPAIRQDAHAYGMGVLNAGRLIIAQGEQFLEVDPQGMQLTATYPLPPGTPSIWNFVLSDDKTRIYTVTFSPEGIPNVFIAMNTATFQLEKQTSLAGGYFEYMPFELPDGSKLYALGGMPNGPVIVHVIGTTDYAIQKTITFDQSDRLGISAGPYHPYAYDPASHTLFVGATHVVLAIDTITDTIKKVIYLGDTATAIGLQPSQVTYLNAVGFVYNPTENYLYIAHADRSFVSIYDLTNDQFLPKAIPLKGYFPNFLFTNDAYSKIYSLNYRSDSVTVIDVLSKTVEKVIDLHDYSDQACTYSLSPYADGFASTNALGVVTVSPTSSSCSWTAVSNDSWITITSGSSGIGSGTVSYSIAANTTGSSRTGTITIGGQTFTVTQTAFNAALYFPHVDTSLPWQTEIAIVNTSPDQTIIGTLRTLNNDGQLIETKDVTLSARGRRQIIVADEFTNHINIGYIIFDTNSADVQGYTKFYQEGVYRAAIPAVKEVNASDIYISHIDSSAQWWTGVSLVNTTAATKNLTITFNNGVSVPCTLNANQHSVFTIGSLLNQPLQPDIRSAVITNASGIIGLELFGSHGDGNQLEGVLLTDKTASTLYYPHVDDNDWWTGIVAYNPSESACTITITPYSASGTTLATSTLSINGKGKYVGTVAQLGLHAQTAWFRIDSTRPLSGFELFGTANGNQLAAYGGNGGTGGKTGVFAKIEKNGGWTGIAFVNTEDGLASVTLTAYNDNGTVVATQVLPVSGHAKVVNLAEAIFAQNIGSATYIVYSSDRNVVGFQLNGTSDDMMLDGLPGLGGAN